MAQESRIKMDTTGFFEYEKNITNLERDTWNTKRTLQI